MGYFLAGNCGHVLNSLPDYILVDSNTSIKSFEVRESVCLSSGLFTSSRPKAACRCDMAMLSTCCPWHFNQEPLHVSILCGVIFCEQYSTYCGKPDSSKRCLCKPSGHRSVMRGQCTLCCQFFTSYEMECQLCRGECLRASNQIGRAHV